MNKEEKDRHQVVDRIDKLQKRVERSNLEETISVIKPMLEMLGVSAQAITNQSLSPSLQLAIHAITQGEMPYGEATEKVAIAIADVISVLEGKKIAMRTYSMRTHLLATALTAASVIARQVTVNGLGPLPGDAVDKKRAKVFTLDLIFAFVLKSEFLNPLFERLSLSLNVEEQLKPQICDLFSLVMVFTMLEGVEDKGERIEEMMTELESRLQRLEQTLSTKIVGSGDTYEQKSLLALREVLNALRAHNFQGLEMAITRLLSLANITKEEIQADLKKIA
ncbi:MAG: hypothetical protein WD595_04415, partial [Waddliaceae bacterium]